METKLSDEDMVLEDEYLKKIVKRYLNYRDFAHVKVRKMTQDYLQGVSGHHQARLGDLFKSKLISMKKAIDTNQTFIELLVRESGFSEFLEERAGFDSDVGRMEDTKDISQKHLNHHEMESDMDNVCSSLRQFVRDWSLEGATERSQCYDPILREIDGLYGGSLTDRSKVAILVPGCGLGRLPYEIAKRGFKCQGNEFSYYMLMGADMMLNRVKREFQYQICPYVLQVSNAQSAASQTKAILIPDIIPNLDIEDSQKIDINLKDEANVNGEFNADEANVNANDADVNADLPLFSMVAGDFLEVYANDHNRWDVIVTCFFMDTAKNVLLYIDYIYRMLKPGGRWINFGPLLYHFESTSDATIELTAEEFIAAVKSYGFTNFTLHEPPVKNQNNHQDSLPSLIPLHPCSYAKNQGSMFSFQYQCIFFTAQK